MVNKKIGKMSLASFLVEQIRPVGRYRNIVVPETGSNPSPKRWLHSLSPTIKKSAWTSAEDDLLVSLYNAHGTKWSTIARGIPGRTDDACSKRYREALDPALKKDEWTLEEDKRLMELFAEVGGKWGQVGQELQRSGLGCRNRHRLLLKRGTKVFYDPVPDEASEIPQVQPVIASHTDDFVNWPHSYPYYPPEAYSSFPGEGSSLGGPFRALTPDGPNITPDVAPFQFSSSSLSAALSVVPQASESLPTVYEGPEAPPLSNSDQGAAHTTDSTSPDDFPVNFMPSSDLSQLFLGVHFDDNGVFHFPEAQATQIDLDLDLEGQQWSPIGTISSPASGHGQLCPESMSSTLSTPYSFPLSLSDCSTPKSSSPVDLSTSEYQPNLVILSPNRRSQRMKSRKGRKMSIPEKPLRLSSSLILTTE
ncbi:hypothetical protein DXG01_004260 [Tephrocybe rancida]|nr:hypothetical protein DXG01_004260 [Tephrocybe rancida]